MNEVAIYKKLTEAGLTHTGACALMGNLYAESGLRSDIMEQYYTRVLCTDSTRYTSEVDSGERTDFVTDSVGYGIAQWTYHTRKKALLQYAQKTGRSIGNLDMQLEYLLKELAEDFPGVLSVLKNPKVGLREASDIVMVQFENPENQSETAKQRRCTYSMTYMTMFQSGVPTEAHRTLREGDNGTDVLKMQEALASAGYLRSGECDGIFGRITLGALLCFQFKKSIAVDGICGTETWRCLAE